MKLKNSYILLIVMSIFLLISIGSVCAEDTGAADADVLSEDGGVDTPTDGDSADTNQKINTTVVSENVKVKENDPVELDISVKDNESNSIDIAKENITVSEGNKTINFNYNNSIINVTDKLAVGNHSIIINYLGNNVYTNSTTSIILSIIGNNTLEVPSTVSSDGNTVEIPIKLTDGVDDNTNLLNSTNTELSLISSEGNETINIEDVLADNKLTIDVSGKLPATLIVNYTENNQSVSKKINIKYLSKINASESIEINEKDNLTFVVEVLDNDDNIIANITKSNLTITGAKDFSYNETTHEVKITGLAKGVHTLTIAYKGSELYDASNKTTVVSVRGAIDINVNKTSINVNSTKKGEIIIINITDGVDLLPITKDNISISVSYKDGNNTTVINVKSFDVVNGTLSFELENGNFTTATLVINYNTNQSSKNITLNRIYNAEIKAMNTENQYQNGNFTFKLVDVDDNSVIAGRSISLYTTGNIRAGFSATTDENGIATFKTANLYEFDQSSSSLNMKQLEVGNHAVEISTSGNVKSTTLKTNLTITKADINIKIDEFKEMYGTDKNVTITVTNAKDGSAMAGVIIHLYMPQTSGKDYYFQTDSTGQSKIAVKNLISGTYDITVSNNDTKNINKKEVNGSFTIIPIPVNMKVETSTISYNTGTTATVTITDSDNNPLSGVYVIVVMDKNVNKTYLFQTNNKGKVSFSASLDVGKHQMAIATADNRYDGGSVTKTVTVKKAVATLKVPKVTTYYKGGKYLTITLTNSKNKKPIYDAKLNIKIYVSKTQYYNYKGNTGGNGQLKLLIDLKPGKYKVEVSGADSKNFNVKTVTSKIVVKKAPTKFVAKKLTVKKGANKKFKVTAKNKKTKKVIAGIKVKIKVYTGKKSITYTVKTNSKGIAKISTKKLTVGNHKVVITSANKYCVAKKAKSTIKITK